MKKSDLVSVVIVSFNRKKELIECLESCYKSKYPSFEIILVDNASKLPIVSWLPKKYSKVKLVTNDINYGAAEGRNIGLKHTKGKYILFMDDDATMDQGMISSLVKSFQSKKKAGIIQPLIIDKKNKNLLQGAGHDISFLTGRIRAWGAGEKNRGQYEGLRNIPMAGCIWMVKRSVFDKIGTYDNDYFIPYEDSDFSARARKAGYEIYCDSEALSWHEARKRTYVSPLVDLIGITSPERAYRTARNKLIFMRKHAGIKFIPFFFILLPVYVTLHTIFIVLSKRFDILALYWKGLLSGIFYSVTYMFKKHVA